MRGPARSRSLLAVQDQRAGAESSAQPSGAPAGASDGSAPPRSSARGPGALDGVTKFMGMRWDDAQTVRLEIRPELINAGGLLSGVVTYALVDYCMGSTLWAQTTEQERIATINIALYYIQTATEGEIICRSELDRRNRTIGIMKSSVHAEDGTLLVTAVGSYSIFVPKHLRR
jgi:1,4-dihydroxy-2-naphthoyl-CoA hydrolase